MRLFLHIIKMVMIINIVLVFLMSLVIHKCINYYFTESLYKVNNLNNLILINENINNINNINNLNNLVLVNKNINKLNDLILVNENINNSFILRKQIYIQFDKNEKYERLNIIKITNYPKNINNIFLLYNNRDITNLTFFTQFSQEI